MSGKASQLIRDLNNVPKIIGALGISIAEAQKALNLDYLDNLERLIALAESLLRPKPADGGAAIALTDEQRTVLTELVKQLAPSRYQFTETSLSVKLNLAQTMDVGGSAGFSAGVGAVAVNAGMTVGFGFDYQAAAEVRTVLHAIPANDQTLGTLLARTTKLGENALALPPAAQVDKDLIEKSHDIATKLID